MFKQTLRSITILLAASVMLGAQPVAALVPAGNAAGQSPADQVDARVESLLSQMTLAEKIKIMSGTEDEMHVPGIERLGIPELKFSDGPVGVRCWGKATAYPAGAMLAATWDVDAARETGRALGRDCRARGVHVLLGPGVDLYRVAQCGRNFEYFGEDPYLSAQLASAWIKGVQGQGVATSVKHYAANDQEILRDSINTLVDERRLHEICFPPFKAAIQDGNAWTVMAAYNKLNGSWCTANSYLLDDVLRKQWGFKGILMSDWGAVHEAPGPLTAGTDLEMGRGVHYTPTKIEKLIKEGKVTQAQIDEHVRRILRTSVAMGFFDRPQEDKSIPQNDPKSVAAALRVAREGLVLLKNQRDLLPLDRSKLHNVVVIGPNALPAQIGGGGSSQTEPFSCVSLYDAIAGGAGQSVNVSYIPTWAGADPLDKGSFNNKGYYEPLSDDGARGLKGEYFASSDLSGAPTVVRTDSTVNFLWDKWKPDNKITTPTYSARWTGKFKAPQTDDYTLSFVSDGARVSIDGKPVFDNWSQAGTVEKASKPMHFVKGEPHDILIEYRHLTGPASMQFTWAKAKEALTAEQTKLISSADAVVAAVGFNNYLESEGFDRPYDLPAEQVDMLRRVAQLNPRTIAVLNAGGNVGMDKWVDGLAALMHAWYPGQNGNTAVAEAIFGDINPSGKLPDTFEKQWQDSPAYGHYPGDQANGGTVKYNEGIYVGYRWFNKKNVTPRYPFGYGLSYTSFGLQNLKLAKQPAGYQVSVDVTNTGKRAGAQVVQVYIRPQNSAVDRPVQELKAFARVELAPGQTRTVTMPLSAEAFALWDEKKHDWVTPEANYEIAVGSSSRDIQASQSVAWKN